MFVSFRVDAVITLNSNILIYEGLTADVLTFNNCITLAKCRS